MDLTEVLRTLGIEDCRDAIESGWDESCATAPAGDLAFLEPPFVEEACRFAHLPDDITRDTVAVAGMVAGDPVLRALAWHAHCRVFGGGEHITDWPIHMAGLETRTGLFYLLVTLSNFPAAQAAYQEHQIPERVVAHTMIDFMRLLKRFRKRHGVWGVAPLYAGGWLKNHFTGRIYRLGRLQYIQRPFTSAKNVAVYRRRADGRVVALAGDGLEFRSDGLLNGTSGITDTDGTWTSVLQAQDGVTEGNPIDPSRGAALRETVRLPDSAWGPALKAGDSTLEMHIPPDDPFTRSDCADSARQASEFFTKHFPENPPPKALFCNTWLLWAGLEAWLKPESNIVQFLRQFYLFPVGGDAWSAYRFVFGLDIPFGADAQVDVSELPRNTSLERSLIEHVEAGGRWGRSGGFILMDDLPWGTEPYRRLSRPWEG